MEHVADEAVYKELDDILVRVATTASSLKTEQDSGDTIAQTRSDRVSKLSNDSLLARENEIDIFKRRAKKLKKKQRLRTHKLKRLYKVGLTARVESLYNEQSLGDDASKQGRINDIDANEGITLVSTHDAKMFDDDEDLHFDEDNLAQALAKLKHTKPKSKAKGIVFHEPEESTTTTIIPKPKLQDEGKAIMIEAPVKLKKKDQIMLDEEIVLKSQNEIDKEQRLAREKAQKEEKANIALIETWDDKRRKFFAAKRAEEKRNKPPTQAQQRKIMCTCLKNVEGKKLTNLKNKSFDYIQNMFDIAFKWVNTFVDFKTEFVEELRRKLEVAQKEKDGIQHTVEKHENASKSLNKLIDYQIVENCKKELGYKSYNDVPPPYTGNFMPFKPDLSYTGLDEFTNKPVAENTKFSEEETKAARKNSDAPIIEKWVLDDEDDNVAQPKIVKKTVKPNIDKKEGLDLEQTKTTQENEIDSLKRRVKKLKKKQRLRTHKIKRLYKFGLTARVKSSNDEQSLGEDASKQGRISDIDADEGITLVSTHDDAKMFDDDEDLHGEGVLLQSKMRMLLKKKLMLLKFKLVLLQQLLQSQLMKLLWLNKKSRRKEEQTTNTSSTKKNHVYLPKEYKRKKKLIDLKNKSFDSIHKMFDRDFKRVNTFVDFRTELVEGSLTRAGTELEQESSKKQKIDDDKETAELK
nr:hypothetical protein [Tanacetum cinerariifolium]